MRGMKEQLIQLHSTENSPWIPVERLKKLDFKGAGKEDLFRVHVRTDAMKSHPDPKLKKGPGGLFLSVSRGKIRVERLKGTSPTTILAYSRRFTRAIEANGGNRVRRSDGEEGEQASPIEFGAIGYGVHARGGE